MILIKYWFLKKKHGIYNSFKYFIVYNDNDVNIRPSYLFLWQMAGYINKFEKNKIATMSLMIKDTQLSKNYNKIWKKNWKINENRL